MDNPNSQIAERLQQATNILVTVSNNPSVDQLSSAIGLTLLLNKLGKHAVAVFSGNVPSTIEFLQPEKTFEKTTDSLRDFIIALDKSKADKLRYKVEDQMVKIFITPYRTSISEQDLDFSQGDFNVEVVVALGVNEQKDLDQAIMAHGRILHDATVISINTQDNASLGSINWHDPQASSLSEMLVALSTLLKAGALDGQMATAFLTGIVAETDRFSNDKTSSATMQASAQLMAAGANQQLIATQLQQPSSSVPLDTSVPQASIDGSLDINHGPNEGESEELPEPDVEQINISDDGVLAQPSVVDDVSEPEAPEKSSTSPTKPKGGRGLTLNPPSLGGRLTANSEPEGLDPSTDPLGEGKRDEPLLSHEDNDVKLSSPVDEQQPIELPKEVPNELRIETSEKPETSSSDLLPTGAGSMLPPASPSEPPLNMPPSSTLAQIEQSVQSPHTETIPPEQAEEVSTDNPTQSPQGSEAREQEDLVAARDAVMEAVQGSTPAMEPMQRMGAQPMELDLNQLSTPRGLTDTAENPAVSTPPVDTIMPNAPAQLTEEPSLPVSESPLSTGMELPPGLVSTTPPVDNTASTITDPPPPPPVPPPITLPDEDQPPAGPS